ncbi:MAG TPA: Calx-beta domain-containing protein, partial [Methylomirabilota bacterium]|nr:Calx-beta domain-containing protein [Methylomirabilota bacterium]
LVGAREADGPANGRPDAGEAHLIYSPTALPGSRNLATEASDSVVYGADGGVFPSFGDRAGWTVLIADLDGNGLGDLVVAATFASGPSNARALDGEAYLVLSTPPIGPMLADFGDAPDDAPACGVMSGIGRFPTRPDTTNAVPGRTAPVHAGTAEGWIGQPPTFEAAPFQPECDWLTATNDDCDGLPVALIGTGWAVVFPDGDPCDIVSVTYGTILSGDETASWVVPVTRGPGPPAALVLNIAADVNESGMWGDDTNEWPGRDLSGPEVPGGTLVLASEAFPVPVELDPMVGGFRLKPFWSRLHLSDEKMGGTFNGTTQLWDGSGRSTGYTRGETEDWVARHGGRTRRPRDYGLPPDQEIVLHLDLAVELGSGPTNFSMVLGSRAGAAPTTTIFNPEDEPFVVGRRYFQQFQGLALEGFHPAIGTIIATQSVTRPSMAVREITAVNPDGGLLSAAGSHTLALAVTVFGDTFVVTELHFVDREPSEAWPLVADLRPSVTPLIRTPKIEPTRGTIAVEPQRPRLSIGDAYTIEGNEGGGVLVFPVTMTRTSSVPVEVRYWTEDSSAIAGEDYISAPAVATLTLPPGATQGQISIAVIGDTIAEGNEFFSVFIYAPEVALVEDQRAIGEIIDDDSPPPDENQTLSIGDVVVREDEGTAIFTVNRIGETFGAVAAAYLTRSGTATSGNDYEPRSGVIIFPAEVAQLSVQVPVVDDLEIEGDETFFVTLVRGYGVLLERTDGTATIRDNDAPTILASGIVPLRLRKAALDLNGVVPAGFFGSGTSVPDVPIEIVGLSLASEPAGILAGADTLLRLDDPAFDPVARRVQGSVSVEALHYRSAAPISVLQRDGSTQHWTLDVRLAPSNATGTAVFNLDPCGQGGRGRGEFLLPIELVFSLPGRSERLIPPPFDFSALFAWLSSGVTPGLEFPPGATVDHDGDPATPPRPVGSRAGIAVGDGRYFCGGTNCSVGLIHTRAICGEGSNVRFCWEPVKPSSCTNDFPDADGDNWCDDVDNCRQTPNPWQEDADGDGVGDDCDDCDLFEEPCQEPSICPMDRVELRAAGLEFQKREASVYQVDPIVEFWLAEDVTARVPVTYEILVNGLVAYTGSTHWIEVAGARCLQPGCVTPPGGCQVRIQGQLHPGRCATRGEHCYCSGTFKPRGARLRIPDGASVSLIVNPDHRAPELDPLNNVFTTNLFSVAQQLRVPPGGESSLQVETATRNNFAVQLQTTADLSH